MQVDKQLKRTGHLQMNLSRMNGAMHLLGCEQVHLFCSNAKLVRKAQWIATEQ